MDWVPQEVAIFWLISILAGLVWGYHSRQKVPGFFTLASPSEAWRWRIRAPRA